MKINYYMPTKVIMGNDCIVGNAKIFSEYGKKCLIVSGRKSARLNGSMADVIKALEANAQDYAIFDKVDANPTIACVYEGARFSKEVGADFIVAIGGGSPIDAAKVIAILSTQDIEEEKLFSTPITSDVMPILTVPTTSGTGSEITQYSILTNDVLQTKSSIASPYIFPKVAFLDGKYMLGLDKKTTINTVLDALTHLIEGYLSVKASPISDIIALEGIKKIVDNFKKLASFELDLNDRFDLLYASNLGGMVIANTGTTSLHALGYSLTYFKNIDHGRANGMVLGEYLTFLYQSESGRINVILDAIGMSLDEFKKDLNKLTGDIEEITLDELKKYASIGITAKNNCNTRTKVSESDLLEIYKKVFIGGI